MGTVIILSIVGIALLSGFLYAGLKIILLPIRLIFFILNGCLKLIVIVLRSLFSPLTKEEK